MRCELCGKESNIIYATRKHGLICSECQCKTKNSAEEKLKEKKELLEMYRRYGVDVQD